MSERKDEAVRVGQRLARSVMTARAWDFLISLGSRELSKAGLMLSFYHPTMVNASPVYAQV